MGMFRGAGQREKLRQVRRPLTDKEKRWRLRADKDWKQELEPTGRFVLAIKTFLSDGFRTEWTETETKSIEIILPEFIATIVAVAPALKKRREEKAEEERVRRVAELERLERERIRKREDARWVRFVEFSKQQRDVDAARDFLASLRAEQLNLEEHVGDGAAREV